MIVKLAKRYCDEVCMVELEEKKDLRGAFRCGGGANIPEGAVLVLPTLEYKDNGERYTTINLKDIKRIWPVIKWDGREIKIDEMLKSKLELKK